MSVLMSNPTLVTRVHWVHVGCIITLAPHIHEITITCFLSQCLQLDLCAAVWFYLANEGLSILENMTRAGVKESNMKMPKWTIFEKSDWHAKFVVCLTFY
jgi:phage-related holin